MVLKGEEYRYVRNLLHQCRFGERRIADVVEKLALNWLRSRGPSRVIWFLEEFLANVFDRVDEKTLRKIVRYVLLPRVDKIELIDTLIQIGIISREEVMNALREVANYINALKELRMLKAESLLKDLEHRLSTDPRTSRQN